MSKSSYATRLTGLPRPRAVLRRDACCPAGHLGEWERYEKGGGGGCKGERGRRTRQAPGVSLPLPLPLRLDHCQTEDTSGEEGSPARTHEGGGGREDDVTPCHPAAAAQQGPPPLSSASGSRALPRARPPLAGRQENARPSLPPSTQSEPEKGRPREGDPLHAAFAPPSPANL